MTVDVTPGTEGTGPVMAIQHTGDGDKIVLAAVGGARSYLGKVVGSDAYVVRLNLDGTIDRTFGDIDAAASRRTGAMRFFAYEHPLLGGISIDNHNRVLLSGSWYHDDVTNISGYVMRLTPDGVLDATFSGGGFATIGGEDGAYLIAPSGIASLADGTIVVATTNSNLKGGSGDDEDICLTSGTFQNLAPQLHDPILNVEYKRVVPVAPDGRFRLTALALDDSFYDGITSQAFWSWWLSQERVEWSVIDKPNGANDPTLVPESADPRSVDVTVTKAGQYRFRFTMTDSEGKVAVVDQDVVIEPVDTATVVSPSAAILHPQEALTLNSTMLDQFDEISQSGVTQVPDGPGWTDPANGELRSASGSTQASYIAKLNGRQGDLLEGSLVLSRGSSSRGATIDLPYSPPQIDTPPFASANPVTTKTVTLHAAAHDEETDVSYTWSVLDIGNKPRPVFGDENGSPSASSINVTFDEVGRYHFLVTVSDAAHQTVSQDLWVDVLPTFSGVTIDYPATMLLPGGNQQFTAVAEDQFGDPLPANLQPANYEWSVDTDGANEVGVIDLHTGLYTAPATSRGTYTIRAEATIGGAQHEGVNTISVPASGPDTVWYDDDYPAGALLDPYDQPAWTWVHKAPRPHQGTRAHVSDAVRAIGFRSATAKMEVPLGGSLFVYAYLDDGPLPTTDLEVAWQSTAIVTDNEGNPVSQSVTSVAHWGAHFVQRSLAYHVGNLPAEGRWVRLEVPAAYVGVNQAVDGMTFSAWHQAEDGTTTPTRVVWDDTGTAPGTDADAPTVAQPADAGLVAGSLNPGQRALTVLGRDDGGEQALTYTWKVVEVDGEAVDASFQQPQFSENQNHAASATEVTFAHAGTYTLEVDIVDRSGQHAADSDHRRVEVTIDQIPFMTFVSGVSADGIVSTVSGGSPSITAQVVDQFGDVFDAGAPIQYAWSFDDAGEDSRLLPSGDGNCTVTYTPNSVHTSPSLVLTVTASAPASAAWAQGSVGVIVSPGANAKPTIARRASWTAVNSPVTQVRLSVLGADADSPESDLTYTWSLTGTTSIVGAPVAPEFSSGTNAAKNCTVTLHNAGKYTFGVTISDGQDSVPDTVTFTVDQTFTQATINGPLQIVKKAQAQFSATAMDQFGQQMTTTPTASKRWALGPYSVGYIVPSTGVYTATDADYSELVKVTWSGVTAAVPIDVGQGSPPVSFTTPFASDSTPVRETTLSVAGSVRNPAQDAQLKYLWSVSAPGVPAAEMPTFSTNNTNAAKQTRVTFHRAGSYELSVQIIDRRGVPTDVPTKVLVNVNQTATAIRVSPANAVLANNAVQHFTASAVDQFGNALDQSSQPTAFTWSLAADGMGGSILDSSGGTRIALAADYRAPTSNTGSDRLIATAGTLSGTSLVSVNAAPTECIGPQTDWPTDPQVDGGDPGSLTMSGDVRYFDGRVLHSASDLSAGSGLDSGLSRTWSSEFPNQPGPLGLGWAMSQFPYLEQRDGGNRILAHAGQSVLWFTEAQNGGNTTYIADLLNSAKLLPQAGGGFKLIDSLGDVTTFSAFGGSVLAKPTVAFDAGMNQTVFDYDVHTSALTGIKHYEGASTAKKVLEQITFTPDQSDPTRTKEASLSRLSKGSLQPVQLAVYDYDTAGRLSHVSISQFGQVVEDDLYRYNSAGLMTLTLEGAAYVRARADLTQELSDVLDTQLEPFANAVFDYYTNGKVQSQTLQGEGTHTYDYASLAVSSNINSVSYRTTVHLPVEAGAGSEDTVTLYMNYLGEVLLRDFSPGSANTATTSKSRSLFEYDSEGRLTREAAPSAVNTTLAVETVPANLLLPGKGLNHEYQYIPSGTTAAGYRSQVSIRHGASGVLIPIEKLTYVSAPPLVGESNMFLPSTDTVYREENGLKPIQTTYSYEFYPNSDQVHRRTVTLPAVSATQNGNGSTTVRVDDVLDAFGRVVWHRDPDNYLDYTEYDSATGAVVKSIADAQTARTVDFTIAPPVFGDGKWLTLTGAGLHLVTLTEIDALGRPISVTDPKGQITSFGYTDSQDKTITETTPPRTSSGKSAPIQFVVDDQANGVTYSGTVAASDHSTVQSLTASKFSEANQLIEVDRFTDLAGVTYANLSVAMSNGKYSRTTYVYDLRGRRYETIVDSAYYQNGSAIGGSVPNVAVTKFDGLDRPIQTLTGVSDAAGSLNVLSQNTYDGGQAGDGNLTRTIAFTAPGALGTARISDMAYDWRDRLVSSKTGVSAGGLSAETNTPAVNRPLTFNEYDNLDHVITTSVYDGDGVALVDANGTPVKPAAGLVSSGASLFDDRGQVYRTLQYNVVAGARSGSLATDYWHDNRGDVIKTRQPGGLVNKSQYDGAGRITVQAATDGGGDPAPGQSDPYAYAANFTGDIVLQEADTFYDANGNAIQTATKLRNHDAADKNKPILGSKGNTGLDPFNSRVSFAANWCDEDDRLLTSINYGNHGDNGDADGDHIVDFVRPNAPDARDATVTNGFDQLLRTDYEYDAAGNQASVTDPRGIKTRVFYDPAGRKTELVEAYGGTIDTVDSPTDTLTGELGVGRDANRKTRYAYNGLDQLTKQTSVTFAPADPLTNKPDRVLKQDTVYTYGVTGSADIAANDNHLLRQIEYSPLEDAPQGVLTNKDKVVMSGYNLLGENTKSVGRDGVTHTYTFDPLGRLISDKGDTSTNGRIDGSVDELRYQYDAMGRGVLFTTLKSGTVLNEVRRDYDGLGHLVQEHQDHTGAIDHSGTSPTVTYTYDTDTARNYSRLQTVTYPSQRSVSYVYGYDGIQGAPDSASASWLNTLNNSISRVGYLVDGNVTPGKTPDRAKRLETYDYLGLNQVVVRDFPTAVNDKGASANIGVSFISDTFSAGDTTIPRDDAGPEDEYDGLDRFGRVVDYGWYGYSRRHYAYDADGNMLYAKEPHPTLDYTWRSEIYHLNGEYDPSTEKVTYDPNKNGNNAYDKLNRMKGYFRGQMYPAGEPDKRNTSVVRKNLQAYLNGPLVATQYLAQDNWDTNGSGDYNKHKPSRNATQIAEDNSNLSHVFETAMPGAGTAASPQPPTSAPNPAPHDPPRRDLFVSFDPWGRLAQEGNATLNSSVAGWSHQRPFGAAFGYDALGRRISENYTDRFGKTWKIDLYTDADGNVIEERTNHDNTADAPKLSAQYVYSAASAGMLVLQDADTDSNAKLDQRLWVMQGPDGSVWTIRKQGGDSSAREDFLYTPEGQVTFLHYVTGLEYIFSPNSYYDWRYLWHGGRAELDQDVSDPINNRGGFIEKSNNLLYLNGGEYDTGKGRPLHQDPYAYQRPSHENTDRSSVDILLPDVGTQPLWTPSTAGSATFTTFGSTEEQWSQSEFVQAIRQNCTQQAPIDWSKVLRDGADEEARLNGPQMWQYSAPPRTYSDRIAAWLGQRDVEFVQQVESHGHAALEVQEHRYLEVTGNYAAANEMERAAIFNFLIAMFAGGVADGPDLPQFRTPAITVMVDAPALPALEPPIAAISVPRTVSFPVLNDTTCFVAGTRVLMADGSTKPIEDVEEGDQVLADDPGDGVGPEPREVTAWHLNWTKHLTEVSVDRNGDNVSDGSVEATRKHPFWTENRGWVDAQDLGVGDQLLDAFGHVSRVTNTKPVNAVEPVFNLSVDGMHTFFVMAGNEPLLVHNTNVGPRMYITYQIPGPNGTVYTGRASAPLMPGMTPDQVFRYRYAALMKPTNASKPALNPRGLDFTKPTYIWYGVGNGTSSDAYRTTRGLEMLYEQRASAAGLSLNRNLPISPENENMYAYLAEAYKSGAAPC